MHSVAALLLILITGWIVVAEEHTIHWNVSNDDFRFPEELSNTITVSMDDTLRVVCPDSSAEKRFLKIHKVSALSFTECLLETKKTLVVTCDGSEASKKPTIIGVRRVSPLPSAESILFEPGETYYWITTSSGERAGINQSQYGMCAADNMRLVIHVRAESEARSAEVRTTTSRSLFRDPALRQSDVPVNPKFSAIAHSLSSYPQRRDQKIPDGFTSEQLQKVAALAQKGATGTFTFDTPLEHSRENFDANPRAGGVLWDSAPLLENVLSGASDSILIGTHRIGDEEGAFVVHEDIARSYEYQSNSEPTSNVSSFIFVVLLVCNALL